MALVWSLYVVDGRVQPRTIDLLGRSGGVAAVPGECVIVYPGDRISPGVRVSPK